MMDKRKTVKAWGGFCDGQLHIWPGRSSFAGEIAVFSSRKFARLAYEDVRRIEIREVPRPKREHP